MDESIDRRTWIGRLGIAVAGSVALACCPAPEEDGGDGEDGGDDEEGEDGEEGGDGEDEEEE